MGPHPYPTIVRDFQRVIGDEAAAQIQQRRGPAARLVVACVGGGSNAIGSVQSVHRRARRASGRGRGGRPRHRHRPSRGGARRRQPGHHPRRADDAAPGCRRPGPRGAVDLRWARLSGRRPPARGFGARRPLGAGRLDRLDRHSRRCALLAQSEGILPALEPAHALAALPRFLADVAPGSIVVVGLSGRGDKDLGHLA